MVFFFSHAGAELRALALTVTMTVVTNSKLFHTNFFKGPVVPASAKLEKHFLSARGLSPLLFIHGRHTGG